MGVGCILPWNIVIFRWKLLMTNRWNLVQRLDLEFSWLVIQNISEGIPLTATMLDLDRCEVAKLRMALETAKFGKEMLLLVPWWCRVEKLVRDNLLVQERGKREYFNLAWLQAQDEQVGDNVDFGNANVMCSENLCNEELNLMPPPL